MSKLTGYKAVAVIKQGYANKKNYHFAIYDDGFDYQPGDKVILSNSDDIWTINEIITPEEATARFNKNIIAEVVCKVDTNSYDKRVQKRKEIEKLKRDMDKKIKEMDESKKYEMYAAENSELKNMLEAYKALVNEN